ncbi:TonB-dependent receptor domain-containing protein [Phenylobacterium deserti]|uniref:TonB-dependent receptor n=1 Tax=Phenylobacterium deserti TaxID=1914756 RepID=A0A328APS3_9CAUL|nr:TonB-dependent receptor [Phenylobacterium deserti]RAK57013.1 TonB-dependent receptor [Phenylobacterium deserti]
MKYLYLSAAIAPLLLITPAQAQTRAAAQQPAKNGEAVFSTGVAKGRDRLDSATSTSALRQADIEVLGARSLGEVLRNIPGIRAEHFGREGNSDYTIRGLPLSGNGSKYVQLQEEGLPVLEFADLSQLGADMFLRADLNLSQIETIRGGSASTFASNSPGGVINLLSKTGDVEGGAIAGTLGLNYGEHRVDADYGAKLSDTLRFHVGGFYRQGEGPREVGYDAYKGGQIKANITKQFANGHVRVYGKWLDDRTPAFQDVPLLVTGTNADPDFRSPNGFDLKKDTLLSDRNSAVTSLNSSNQLMRSDLRDGQRAKVKSIGLDAQFDVAGWSISEKIRFSDISGTNLGYVPIAAAPAAGLAFTYGGPGGVLSYATGPNAGQTIANPSTLNGNGLLVSTVVADVQANSLDNLTNDLRASRVWEIGAGELTTTAGFYGSSQDIDTYWSFVTALTDVRGDGETSLINVRTATGVPTTQNGYLGYGIAGGLYHRAYDVNYRVNAPYGSVNYRLGKVAIGASVRWDTGKVNGTLLGAELGGGRVGTAPFDINGDGAISRPEATTGVLPLATPGRVDYDYDYLSYSTGVNYRIAESMAVFARYSRGGRASADKILFTPAIDYNTGKLKDDASAYDEVKQTELGFKYRKSGVTLNVTGFSAETAERNLQINSNPDGSIRVENIVRGYEAKGVELEVGVHHGVFSLIGGATYTDAQIASDLAHPDFAGNTPRHQPDLIFQLTPQLDFERLSVGANFVGATESYAQDTNQLKLPGYTLVNAFVQVRATDRLQLMVNVNNLFDELVVANTLQGSIPANGLLLGRAYNGRTASATLRYGF